MGVRGMESVTVYSIASKFVPELHQISTLALGM